MCHRLVLHDRTFFFGNRFAEAGFKMYLRWIPDLFLTKYLLLFLLGLQASKSNRNYHYLFAVYILRGFFATAYHVSRLSPHFFSFHLLYLALAAA